MINSFGIPPNFLDFQRPIRYYKSEKWHERHLIAPAWMLPANVRLSLSSIAHLYNAIFLFSVEDAKKFTRAITFPVVFLFTIPTSMLFPKAMCQLWGFFSDRPSKENIFYPEGKTQTPVE